MNQPTHAWLAVEAYRKIDALSKKPGDKKKLAGLASLLGENLRDVVVAAWLPDCLIKDTQYGHIFKNSAYNGDQTGRFTLTAKALTDRLAGGVQVPKAAFDRVPAKWWTEPYRVRDKPSGGHLPSRVNALCQSARDMFKMGDDDVVKVTGIKPPGSAQIAKPLLFSPRDIAMTLWMASHYIADAHVPVHCDNRAFASSTKQKTHCDIENLWGDQVPATFHSTKVLKMTAEAILATALPSNSRFAGLTFGATLSPMKNGSDPWLESVYICRASFATSFAMVPPDVAPVDDEQTKVSLADILKTGSFCGEDCFWRLSRAIMVDAVNAIARFWLDTWSDFVTSSKKNGG